MIVKGGSRGRLAISEVKLSRENWMLLKGFPGYSKWEGRTLMIRPTTTNMDHLLDNFEDITWEGEAKAALDAHLAHKREGDAILAMKRADNLQADDSGYVYAREPMLHQQKAFMLSRDQVAFGLFMEQGTGKTKVSIDTACYLYRQGKIDMLVVIAWPNGVHRNWVDFEIPKDIPAWCNYMAEFWSANLTQRKRKAFDRFIAARDCLKIIAFNVEALSSSKGRQWLLKFMEGHRCMVVVDQSASIKNQNAKRTDFIIKQVSERALFRRILDGAPVAEAASELYSQFKFLDPRIIGHDTWTAFRNEFCEIGYFNQTVGYKNMDRLHERIDRYSFRVQACDCLDLPDRVYKRWGFDLSPDERRIFDELNRQSIAQFTPGVDADGKLETDLALVKNMRLQQISSGWFADIDADGKRKGFRTITGAHSRLDALLALLAQADGKALIYSRFVDDIKLICNALGKQAVSYYGATGEDERMRAIKAFQDGSSDIRYFVGQPRSAGIGITLTAARHVVFYTNDSSLRFREECEKRVHRKGLENTLGEHGKLIVWDLLARGTQDAKIINTLRSKKEISSALMQDKDEFFLVESEV